MTIALELKDLSLDYGPRRVIDAIDLQVPKGRFTVLVGPNGCGKSTILKSLIRSQPIASGSIDIEGRPLSALSPANLSRLVSLLPQSLQAPDGVTVRQLVGYGRSPHTNIWNRLSGIDRSVIDAALDRMDVAALADRQVGQLSGGQQQRAWLAMVLAQQTPIVLLDEPTSYLDISHQIEVLHLCQELVLEGKTVVAVLHDLNQAFRYSDHVVVLRNGKILASGEPSAIASEHMLKEAFEVQTRIVDDPESKRPMMIVRNFNVTGVI